MAKSEGLKPQAHRGKRRQLVRLIDTSGSSMTHWSIETQEAGLADLSDLSKKLAENASIKSEGLKFLEENNLPRYPKISVGLEEFLADPEVIFDELSSRTGLYYSSIVDLTTGARVFGLEQNREQVQKFIADKLASQEISLNSALTLSEYWHNYYGGNLIINKDGRVFIELVEGKHAKLVKGEGLILMSVKTDPITGVLKFSENEEMDDQDRRKLRQAVINALNFIPKHLVAITPNTEQRFKEIVVNEQGEASVAQPYAGYYEFILTKADPKIKDWSVIFLDARTGQAADKYQIFA